MSDEMKEEPETMEDPKEETPPAAQWEQKSEFAVVGHMRQAVEAAKSAAEAELAALHRKLERLQYGS
jgi:hypothetical protein